MIDVAWAQAPGAAGPNPALQLVPFALVLGIFFLLVMRPQMKRQREHRELVAGLSKGDQVVTVGGLLGTIVGTKDDVVVIRVADGMKVEVLRTAVTGKRGHTDG